MESSDRPEAMEASSDQPEAMEASSGRLEVAEAFNRLALPLEFSRPGASSAAQSGEAFHRSAGSQTRRDRIQ